MKTLKNKSCDSPGGSGAKTLRSHCRGPRFHPSSGGWSPCATTKDSTGCNKDQPTCCIQDLGLPNKQILKYFKKKNESHYPTQLLKVVCKLTFSRIKRVFLVIWWHSHCFLQGSKASSKETQASVIIEWERKTLCHFIQECQLSQRKHH